MGAGRFSKRVQFNLIAGVAKYVLGVFRDAGHDLLDRYVLLERAQEMVKLVSQKAVYVNAISDGCLRRHDRYRA